MSEEGYTADWTAIRRASVTVDERREAVAKARDKLRRAFERDRAALGGDAYGAELAKHLPKIEQDIFASFAGYLDELDKTSKRLRHGATGYESAEP